MATALDISTRALRRLGVIDALHTLAAEDARDAVAALNEMIDGWATKGADTLKQSDFAAADQVVFWVPPVSLSAEAIGLVSYRGTWNASTNSPTLAGATGTTGHVYKVSVAGSTALDDVSSWSVNDYLVFDGAEWLKGWSSATLNGPVIAMLAMRMADEYGMQPPPTVVSDASAGWSTIQSFYVKAPTAGIDLAIRELPSRTVTVSWTGAD